MTSIIECEWCCDKNCKILGLDKDHWEPFKALCYEEYNHNEKVTKEEFEERYNGHWIYLDKFAKDICETYISDSLDELPQFIKQCIDWDKVWETIEVDYSVYDNYVFRILR
jgi:hypothetical protein